MRDDKVVDISLTESFGDPKKHKGTSKLPAIKVVSKDMKKQDADNKDKDKAKDEKDKEKEKSDTLPPVSFFKLFSYASSLDKLLMLIGTLAAVVSGASMPILMVFLGKLIDQFVNEKSFNETDSPLTGPDKHFNYEKLNYTQLDAEKIFLEDFIKNCTNLAVYMVYTGIGTLVLNYIMVSCYSLSAANQAHRIKCNFMKSIMRQDIGYFDTNQTGDFASRVTADLNRIQEGMGEKVSLCIYFLAATILSLICALIFGWKLTLVIMSVMPVLIISSAIMAKVQASLSGDELSSYGTAGAVAEEVLGSIRTVVAFGGEEKELSRYEKYLELAKKSGIKRGVITSIGVALVWFCIYGSYALAFWYGVKLITESRENGTYEYKPSDLVIVFFNVIMGAMFMGQASPYFEAFSLARGAAAKIYSVIERIPIIDSSSLEGKRPDNIEGRIELEDVFFRYPSRPDVKILKGLSFTASPGDTVALVGPSGCGKSTVIQLLQRFYDPREGEVYIDGEDITKLNVGWLRDHIGVVGQEPILFATTITENIRYGYMDATNKDIELAARAANAHDFISKLPKGYETIVGERGCQLSGGQKQRIAIARALVRNPKILLLDEATSALDTESEAVVQTALDQASEGRTTIVVAHRLSTIRNANMIVVINKGKVQEVGSHAELIEKEGLYYQLVMAQQTGDSENTINEDDEGLNDYTSKRLLERNLSIASAGSINSDDTLPASFKEGHGHTFAFPRVKVQTPGEDEEEEEDENISQKRLFKLAFSDWPYILTGCISATIMGLCIPAYGILFGEIMGILSIVDNQKVKDKIALFAALFILMGIVSGVSCFLQTFMFTIAGERLTMKLRKFTFITMLKQDMAWFDSPKNGTGALCERLSSDAANVQGATGSRMSSLCQSLSTFVASVIIALVYGWKLGLVCLCYVPLVLVATYFESRIVSGQLLSEKAASEKSTKIAVEAIENVRTVAALHQEQTFYAQYSDALAEPHKFSVKKAHIRGLTFGFAQSIISFSYATAMYYGSYLVYKKELDYSDMFKVAETVIFGAMMIGQVVAFAPDYQKAKTSAARIFKLLDLKPTINTSSVGGIKLPIDGNIQFKSVQFCYPNRPEVKVLKGLKLKVEKGQTVALVGSSGCGKSTCVQLLERFYDCDKGEVLIDGKNVQDFNLAWLRSQIGIVSQEPVLFGYSISENIAYGDNSRTVGMDEIINAARQANIHDFVTSLPQGYETSVGDRGTQLSGGQKQRIAIARALVRNPKILLLDEATSALDTESEKIVQEALDKASEGRTCIVIAHRLSTVQNSDRISVIYNGRTVESGRHQDLLSVKGHYYRLCNAQGANAE